MGESTEQTRTFTRIALNPLTCMLGGNENLKYDSESVLEGRRRFKAKQLESQIAEARKHIVKSLKKKMRRAAEAGKEYVRTEEDDVADEIAKMNEVGLEKLLRELTEQQSDPHAALYRDRKPGEAEDAPRVMDVIGTDLVTGLNSPALEEYFVDSLDELCPPLVSTPLLQEKALRLVFSIGIDVVIVDAERSAQLGKLALKPSDLLTSQQTDDAFEYFKLPFGDERDSEDPYFQKETGEMESSDSDDGDDDLGDSDFDSDDSDQGDSDSDDAQFDSDIEHKKPMPRPNK